jgi:peptidoglycan/LPS O-acetylase OafA/YrhL
VVRAIAVLLVIGAHLRMPTPDGFVGSFAWAWHEWGGFGVPLFFTLSGYLVSGLLITEVRRHGSINVGRFLIRRGFKIYPSYFVFLGYLVAMPLLKGTSTLPDLLSDYWANALFLHNYIGPNPALHTWSLAVEEHFYFVLPLLLLVLVRFKLWQWIAPLCLLAPVYGTIVRLACAALGDPYLYDDTMPATHLWADALLVGVGVRSLGEFSPEWFARLRAWRWPLIIVGVFTIASLVLPMPTFNGVSLYKILPIRAASATAILVGVLHLSMATPAHAALGWIGPYSYSIYLWHVTIIGFIHRFVAALPLQNVAFHWVLAATITTLAAVLFGAFMSSLIEWPVLAIRDRFFPSRSETGRKIAQSATDTIGN